MPDFRAIVKVESSNAFFKMRLYRRTKHGFTNSSTTGSKRTLHDSMKWMTKWIRMMALLNSNELHAAMDVFRSAYAEFDPENEMMMRAVSQNLVNIVSSGASLREIDAVLLSDDRKAESLAPFHIVIRRLMGETVRAPIEVLEVADDVMRQMVERKESR